MNARASLLEEPRPWLLVPGLKSALVAALTTGAIATITLSNPGRRNTMTEQMWLGLVPVCRDLAEDPAVRVVVVRGDGADFSAGADISTLRGLSADAARRRDRAAAGVAGLLMTSMHMTLLGVLLALASRPLYGGHGDVLTLSGLSPLQDQHLGGVLMLVFGGVSYLAGALVLLAGLLRDRRGVVANG